MLFFENFWWYFFDFEIFDFFFTSIRKIFLDETLKNFCFERSFTSKTYFCDFRTWFAFVLLRKSEGNKFRFVLLRNYYSFMSLHLFTNEMILVHAIRHQSIYIRSATKSCTCDLPRNHVHAIHHQSIKYIFFA